MIRRAFLVATSLLTAVACGGAASSAAPSSAPITTLRIGYYANLTHAPAIVALQKGYLQDALGSGVSVKPSVFNAGPDAVEALLSGSIDASYVGPNPAVNAFTRSHGEAIRVIAGATSGGAELVVRSAISSPSDLKGRTLASPQLGNTQDVALRWWLQSKGFKTDPAGGGDVHVVPQDNATTLTAFRTGQVDGAWVPEPWATRLVIEGGGHVLVDERDLWPQGRFATTLLVVRTQFVTEHPDAVRELLSAHVKAIDWISSSPADAQAAVNDGIASITGKKLAANIVSGAWQEMTFTPDPVAESLISSADHASRLGLTPKADLKGIYDLSLLNEVLKADQKPAVKSS